MILLDKSLPVEKRLSIITQYLWFSQGKKSLKRLRKIFGERGLTQHLSNVYRLERMGVLNARVHIGNQLKQMGLI